MTDGGVKRKEGSRGAEDVGGGEREGIPAGTEDEGDISAAVCCGTVL